MSSVSRQKVTLFGYVAWRLQNERIRLDVVPEAGGKIVSLFDRTAGVEWLVQPAQSNPFRSFPPGTEYNPNQCGGWDEMFPTILACPYPAPGPWQGIALPDHGELWTQPWQEEDGDEDAIRLMVEGKALPYRFTRTIRFHAAAELRFDYELQNLGEESLAYLWTPHPQFAVEPGALILLPPDVTEVINVMPKEWGPEWGDVGTRNPWPVITGEDGQPIRQDVVRSVAHKGGRKFYLPPERPISWMGLRQPNGATLRMSWDTSAQPYCGVWIDEGFLNSASDVGIEPATGYYDSLALAWRNQRISQLASGGRTSWHLHVSLAARQASGQGI